MYKLISTGPGWVRILWRHDVNPSADVQSAMRAVTAIPGVSLYDPGAFELPCTTWMLPEVQAVADRCNVTLPTLVRDPLLFKQDQLFHHQVLGARWLVTRLRGGLLADAMGLGKTRQAIVAAEALRTQRGPNGAVVIVGPMFARDVWRRELLEVGAITEPSQFCALLTRDLHDGSFRKGARYYYCHYDVADAWWPRLYTDVRPVVSIADEAHWVRNGRAKRSKAVAMISGTTSTRFVLTGTPMENAPSDLWHLLTLASGTRTWGAPNDFRRRYCGATHNGFGLEDGEPTNVAELQARMAPFYLRRTAESAELWMPPLVRSVQTCDVHDSAKVATRELLKAADIQDLVTAISSGMVQQVLPLITRLWQISSAAKVANTVDVIENALLQGESVVTFVWERETAHKIADQMTHRMVITGEHDQPTRDAAVAKFQASKRPLALIASYGALREGVTLHASRTVVLHDLHWLLTTMLQAEARIHRIGQQRPCQAIWMVGAGTIDTILAPVLKAKAEALSLVLDQHVGVEALAETELMRVAGVRTVDQQVEAALALWRQL